MTLDEIKALYAAREAAHAHLTRANEAIRPIIVQVHQLASHAWPVSEGGYDMRLAPGAIFDPEQETFTCRVEHYHGEGVWISEEDGDQYRLVIPARWLTISHQDALIELQARDAARKALLEDTADDPEPIDQEVQERALLAQLQAKYGNS